jgi:hypothetical protein
MTVLVRGLQQCDGGKSDSDSLKAFVTLASGGPKNVWTRAKIY